MRRLALCVLATVLLSLPATAHSATATISGNPLTIVMGDVGQLSPQFTGDTSGLFYTDDGGFMLRLTDAVQTLPAGTYAGSELPSDDVVFAPGFLSPVTGSGTAADPYTSVMRYDLGDTGPIAEVTQTLTYVNGLSRFQVVYAVKNVSGGTLRFRAGTAADLYTAGSDSGIGYFNPGPPRSVGGQNPATGRVGELVESSSSPWSSYLETNYSIVFSTFASPTGFDNTIDPSDVDNGVGVAWETYSTTGLADNATAAFTAIWNFTAGLLGMTAASATQVVGEQARVDITLNNPSGGPAVGEPIVFNRTGANPGAGTVITDGAGLASIVWTGTNAGTDTVEAFADLNGNSTRDGNEPANVATVTFSPSGGGGGGGGGGGQGELPLPVQGVSANAVPLKGKVFVKLAGGAASAAQVKGKGFIPLEQARQVPIGSLFDTSKGTVQLSTAAGTGVQTGKFASGLFQVLQSRKGKGITEMRLKGAGFSRCAEGSKRGKNATASKRRRLSSRTVNRVTSDAKGLYRSRGRHSAATVRGTKWLTADRCDGTLTKVKRGSVTVRDFRRKKNVVVKAGKSYLAKSGG